MALFDISQQSRFSFTAESARRLRVVRKAGRLDRNLGLVRYLESLLDDPALAGEGRENDRRSLVGLLELAKEDRLAESDLGRLALVAAQIADCDFQDAEPELGAEDSGRSSGAGSPSVVGVSGEAHQFSVGWGNGGDVDRLEERYLELGLSKNQTEVLTDDWPPEPIWLEFENSTGSTFDSNDELTLREANRIRRLYGAFGWLRNIGALLVLFAVWQLWGTAISEHHDQSALAKEFSHITSAQGNHLPHNTGNATLGGGGASSSSSTVGGNDSLLPADTQVVGPAPGTAVAHISIPKIGVSQYVVEGTSGAQLAMGPGHYIGTAMPGQAGNVAIAGHRTTHGAPFNRLDELNIGDPIQLATTSGEILTYDVAQTPFPVSPSDVSVLNNFGDNRLTLTTCNPKYSAAQRLIVVATMQSPSSGLGKQKPNVLANVARSVPYRIVASTQEGWRWSSLPMVLMASALLVALGLLNRRLYSWYRRRTGWLILMPIWMAGTYLLFQELSYLLPSSI